MICVSLGNISFEEASKIAAGEDMVELRADLLAYSKEQFEELLKISKKSIFTCRPGVYSENKRKELFALAIQNSATFIDLEIESGSEFLAEIKGLLETSTTELILSYHNFENTPSFSELNKILISCYYSGADLAKIATTIQQEQDLLSIFSLYAEPGRKVLIGMGEKGVISRIAATFLGAEFSFAAPGNLEITAPGQLSVGEMKEILNILKAEEISVTSEKKLKL
jgi:3-dehydroquinate dehydratase type I